jgi:peptidoglycan/xylan/chitin deacetylase (PgdA/CDA1 family)
VTERLFAFRWDVDHRVCATDGLPRIREVCRDFGVPNTFFINMGRSTNLLEWIGSGMARSKAKLADREAVHLIKKTGWPRFLIETALSRPVGLSFIPLLQSLQAEGHELGLHGGMDHVVWSRRFHELPGRTLQADVEEAYRHFVRHFGKPAGFSSPGFYSDERVTAILDRLDFLYSGDAIGGEPHRASLGNRLAGHWTIPVTLSGPRTIPFLEYHGARGTPEPEVIGQLSRHLDEHEWVVFYGHPCYEGVRDRMLRRVFATVVERGFRFVTMQTLAERLRAVALER